MTEQKQTQTEKTYNCYNCDKGLNEIEIYEVDNKIYCEDCYHDKYFHCDNCNEVFSLNYSNDTPEGYFYCNDCFNDNYSYCDNCENCFRNDELYYMEYHNIRGEGYYCDDCRSNGYENEEVIIKYNKEKSKTFKQNPYKNYCGCEIETINSSVDNQFKVFSREDLNKLQISQVEDGSLNDYGIEFRTNVFNGDLLLNKIKAISKALNKNGFKINKECGLHIHIQIKKRTDYIKKLILFYMRFEDFFFRMCSKSRRNNIYCKKFENIYYNMDYQSVLNCKTALQLKELLYNTKNRGRISYQIKEHHNDKRYNWLNLHSVFYRGTLEIRSHNGTTDSNKINNWFLIHLNCLNFIENLTPESIILLPDTDDFFLSLFNKKLQDYIKSRWATFQNDEQDNEEINEDDN